MRHSEDFPFLFDLDPISDPRGSLIYLEEGTKLDFCPKRIYYLYDVPSESEVRGLHAHKKLKQVMIAISGSFSVTASDGDRTKTFRLDSPSKGLYFPAGIWREITAFSSKAVCLVLASEEYDISDYIFDYQEFLAFRGIGGH